MRLIKGIVPSGAYISQYRSKAKYVAHNGKNNKAICIKKLAKILEYTYFLCYNRLELKKRRLFYEEKDSTRCYA